MGIKGFDISSSVFWYFSYFTVSFQITVLAKIKEIIPTSFEHKRENQHFYSENQNPKNEKKPRSSASTKNLCRIEIWLCCIRKSIQRTITFSSSPAVSANATQRKAENYTWDETKPKATKKNFQAHKMLPSFYDKRIFLTFVFMPLFPKNGSCLIFLLDIGASF